MAARSTWTGIIQLHPMVRIPVASYKARDEYEGSTALREVCECCHKPFTQTSTCPAGNVRVGKDDPTHKGTTHMVKAVAKNLNDFVPLDGAQLSAIGEAVNSKVLEVDRVVPYEAVPMEFAVGTVYLRYDKKVAGAEEAVAALHRMLEMNGETLVVKWAHHGNERLAVVHPVGDLLHLTEIAYDQEIRDAADFRVEVDVEDAVAAQVSALLDDKRSDEFEHDGYENAAVAMRDAAIKAAIGGKAPKPRDAADAKDAAPSGLLAALQAASAAGTAKPKAKPRAKAAK